MKENIKELFMQEKYDEVINSLQDIYSKLFLKMLDMKKEIVNHNFSHEELDFDKLASLVLVYYPQYNEQILLLTHIQHHPDKTYLEIINIMLNIYMYISNTYNKDRK